MLRTILGINLNQYENQCTFTELKQAVLLVYCLHHSYLEILLRFLMQKKKNSFALEKKQSLKAIVIYILSLKRK